MTDNENKANENPAANTTDPDKDENPAFATEPNIKLVKTKYSSADILSENKILALGIKECDIKLFRDKKYREAFTLEKWANIPELKAHTFATLFVPLTIDEVKAMLMYSRYIQWRIASKSQQDHGKKASEPTESAQEYTSNQAQFDQVLDALKQKIDTTLEDSKWSKENGFFAKFNTRSPKDVYNYDGDDPVLKKAFFEELDRLCETKTDEEKEQMAKNGVSINDALHAWYITTSKLLQMRTGAEVVDVFSRSFRCLEDLSSALQLGDEHADVGIALRQWDARVPMTGFGEFRCFVNHKKLNAITQYLSMIKFDQLQGDNMHDLIKQRICDFFDSIVKYIPQDSFVVDFILFFNGDKDQDQGAETKENDDGNGGDDDEKKEESEPKRDIILIELNPFYSRAGGGLFSWRVDRELFLNGTGDDRGCELRILKELDPKGLDYLHPTWARTFHEYNNTNFSIEIPVKQANSDGNSNDDANNANRKKCTIL